MSDEHPTSAVDNESMQNMYHMFDRHVQGVDESKLPGQEGHLLKAIYAMNQMYRLPVRQRPSLRPFVGHDGQAEHAVLRLTRFFKTIVDELEELHTGKKGQSIMDLVMLYMSQADSDMTDNQRKSHEEVEAVALTALSDWFADLMVYIMSEAMKFGINIFDVLQLVMGSNFSKLGDDGKPIYDANGKFQKGPNYEPPEKAIHAYLQMERLNRVNEETAPTQQEQSS